MGIKGLNQLLNRTCEMNHVALVPMQNFAHKKIAVDAPLYVCAFKMRNNYVESIVEFLTSFRQHKIHPIFVFDGIAPLEKREERANRAEKRAAARDRIKTLEKDLEMYNSTGEISCCLKELDQRVKKLVPLRISVKRIQDYIDKLKSQVLSLTADDFDVMKSILKAFDIPYITAEGEAEFLCASLNRHGLVDAAMSCDTDVLACLAPTVITKMDGEFFHVMYLEKILAGLKLNEKEFIDLCIMCGTDFNQNIPKVGPIKSFDFITKYKSIDNLPEDVDKTCLNHDRVRGIFSYCDVAPKIAVPYSGTVKYDQLSKWTSNVEVIKAKIKPRPIQHYLNKSNGN